MSVISERLIVALDVDSLKKAKHFVDTLYPQVKIFKVGSQLFTACGPEAVRMIGSKGAKVFLDLKFHDIPNTVFKTVSTGTSLGYVITSVSNSVETAERIKDSITPPVFMMTVHATGTGGRAMLEAAVKGATEKAKELKIQKPYIVGVTRLTSDENNKNTQEEVLKAAKLVYDSGLDGVVCSILEAPTIRKEFGKKFIIVTPGIRPKNSPADDQKRTTTAQEAIKAGADYIVVGRPILEASDPLKAAKELLCQKN